MTTLGHLKTVAVCHWEIVLGHITSEFKLVNDVILGNSYK